MLDVIKGKEKLWVVFWIYNLLIGISVSLALTLTAKALEFNNAITFVTVGFKIVWYIFCVIGLWQCAFNAEKRIWGYLIRIYLGLGITLTIASLFF